MFGKVAFFYIVYHEVITPVKTVYFSVVIAICTQLPFVHVNHSFGCVFIYIFVGRRRDQRLQPVS